MNYCSFCGLFQHWLIFFFFDFKQTKRTKKAGIVGKYGMFLELFILLSYLANVIPKEKRIKRCLPKKNGKKKISEGVIEQILWMHN